ncbi:MAG TPA: PadR family transcriptional regulator [Ktedonobacteraceae bacterium]|nr:PadR family transcriptional regulator [Ktedonobacteraceae bacterium]
MARTFKRSPSSLAVLGLLYERPMHPYLMQQLIKERGKEKVINMERRASLYQTISQLQQAGLIRVRETVREERRPERTVYELTDEGSQTLQNWLREALSTPAKEFPEFPAAISFLPLLSMDDVRQQLETRAGTLVGMMRQIEETLRTSSSYVPRLFLLEDEYLLVTLEAELRWVQSLVDDLRTGRLTWNEAWLRKYMSLEQDG